MTIFQKTTLVLEFLEFSIIFATIVKCWKIFQIFFSLKIVLIFFFFFKLSSSLKSQMNLYTNKLLLYPKFFEILWFISFEESKNKHFIFPKKINSQKITSCKCFCNNFPKKLLSKIKFLFTVSVCTKSNS